MNTVDPKLAFRAALQMVRARPSLLVWKVVADIGAQTARLAPLLVMAAVVGVVLVVNVRQGRGWSQVLALFSDPRFVVGAAGMALATLLAGFALQSLAWSGIWGASGARLRGEDLGFVAAAIRGFWASVWVRVVALLHDVAMALSLATVVVCTLAWNRWWEFGVIGQSVSWGASLTLYVAMGVVFRLTASVTAAAMFIDQTSWARAWWSAAEAVASQPVAFYRIFVHAAATLIPAMLVYYVILFIFNLTYGTAFAPVGEVLRLVGELVLGIGFAVFFLVGQLGFFNGYMLATRGQAFDPPQDSPMARNAPPSLSDLLPRAVPHRVDVDNVLALRPEPRADESPTPAESEPDPIGSDVSDDQEPDAEAFDLSSVLKRDDPPDGSSSR